MTRSNEITVRDIQGKIVNLPNRPPVMLAHDLAGIYETRPEQIRQAVRRNPARFPEDFCFQLTPAEKASLQNEARLCYKGGQAPHAFTRMGANQLSTVLKTPIAAQRSVQIMRAFSALEEVAAGKPEIRPEPIARQPFDVPDTIVADFVEMTKRIIRIQEEKIAMLEAKEKKKEKPVIRQTTRQKRVTYQEHAAMISFAAGGMRHKAISKRLGRPVSTIEKHLRKHRKAVAS